MQLNPYLNFDGQCREAFTAYERILGGKIEMMQTHGESPMPDHVSPEARDRILHVRLAVGDAVLLGSDTPPGEPPNPQGFALSLSIDTPAEAERIFNGLSDGGKVDMPLQETFWAQRFGMLVDKFGIPWMVNCDRPQ